MLFTHINHAEFLIETESGFRIVTDPYDAGCGFPVVKTEADTVLVSHHHHDHDAVENVTGHPQVIDTAGVHTPAQDVRVTAVKGFHDKVQGKARGENLMFLIEADGLRVVHMGDIGDRLTAEQAEALKEPDVLMIPVGGFYTIDGDTAAEIAGQLKAKVVIPMHYKTEAIPDWPISGPEAFLSHYQENDIRRDGEILRVTPGDLSCQPKVALI